MNKHFQEIDESENEPRFGEEPSSSTIMDNSFERYDSNVSKKEGLERRKKDTEDVVVQDV
jgi:hypothetical protein